jgi:hypothetical protein
MDDVEVPSLYVVSRKLPSDEAYPVIHALSLTPVQAVVISDVHDASLALELCPSLLRAGSDEDALVVAAAMAKDMSRPVLVVGEANFLDAIYASGRREAVATEC